MACFRPAKSWCTILTDTSHTQLVLLRALSWVRISYGTNKYVVDSNYNNTEVPADPHEEQASQSSVKVIAARSKAKAKPQKRETAELPRIFQ